MTLIVLYSLGFMITWCIFLWTLRFNKSMIIPYFKLYGKGVLDILTISVFLWPIFWLWFIFLRKS